MTPAPIADALFTSHALAGLERRGLDVRIVRTVLEHPDDRWEVRPGRHVLQAVVRMGSPATPYLVRVFVEVDRTPCEVVTAYRTSRIARYRRHAP